MVPSRWWASFGHPGGSNGSSENPPATRRTGTTPATSADKTALREGLRASTWTAATLAIPPVIISGNPIEKIASTPRARRPMAAKLRSGTAKRS
jgi:hypothetical protein